MPVRFLTSKTIIVDLFFNIRFGIKIMEGLACIIGLLCWSRLSPRFWRAFPVYLFIITCCEFAGWYMNSKGIKGSKWMYAYFVIPLEFIFMYFLYFKNLLPTFKKTVLLLSGVYILTFIIEQLLLGNEKWIWLSMSYTVGNITLLVLGTIYFFQLYNSDKLIEYKTEPFFWVNIGLLLFYVGTMPYYTTFKTLYKSNYGFMMAMAWTAVILNYIMYAFFIISFLCKRMKQ